MDNIIAEVTKTCPREDCSIYAPTAGFSTCMGWTPTYDKTGKRTDRGDPNTHTRTMSCGTCGKRWVISTQYGETTVTDRDAVPSAHQ